MTPACRPLAVVLDMDGTLLDTEPLSARAWSLAASALELPFDPALPVRMIGRNFADCRMLVIEHQGPLYPVDRLMEGWRAAYDDLVEREGVALKDGVAELFAWLDEAAIPRAVATSTRRDRALAKLEHAGLASRLDVLVGGDEVPRGKPEPDIFLEAASRLAVTAGDCVVIEDSDAGMFAAIAAGMTPIMVPDLLPPSPDLVRAGPMVAESLRHALRHLASLPPRDGRHRTIVR